jgi:hypothetical protein
MQGFIYRTMPMGGIISYRDGDAEERSKLFFRWADCSDASLGPRLCGHSTPIEFDLFYVNGHARAAGVRRVASTPEIPQSIER